jgi:hypothetical protein
MAELSDVRRRVRQRIDEAHRTRAERRRRVGAAQVAYERFLATVAVPMFQMFATSVKAEGYPFSLVTPEGIVRLVPEGHPQDFIELELDTSRGLPGVLGRSRFAHGRQTIATEKPLRAGAPPDSLTEEDVLAFLVDAFGAFVER